MKEKSGNLTVYREDSVIQGTNAKKVISEVYASLVLKCTVFGRKSKHKTDAQPDMGAIFHIKNQ